MADGTVPWFKKKAKKLLKAAKEGDQIALALFHQHNKGKELGLQKMQYALARQARFKNWHVLLAATEKQRQEAIDRWMQ